MLYDKFLRASLGASLALALVAAILYSTITNYDSDKFPVIVIINCILLLPLFLIIYYGRRSANNVNDTNAFEVLLTISTIFMFVPLLAVYRFIQTPDIDFLHFLIISLFIVLLWVLNVKSYLSQKKMRDQF